MFGSPSVWASPAWRVRLPCRPQVQIAAAEEAPPRLAARPIAASPGKAAQGKAAQGKAAQGKAAQGRVALGRLALGRVAMAKAAPDQMRRVPTAVAPTARRAPERVEHHRVATAAASICALRTALMQIRGTAAPSPM